MKNIFVSLIMFAFVQIGKAADIVIISSTNLCSITGTSCTLVGGVNTVNLGGRILRFKEGGKITGTGAITNGYIDANYNQDIFDPTLTIQLSPYNENFSACWFGAKGDNGVTNNSVNLQAAINACIAQKVPLFIPPATGTYNFSQSLNIGIGGSTQVQGFHMFGGSQFWQSGNLTTLHYTGNGHSYALGIQIGKGVEINNLRITGMFTPPTTADNVYYLTPAINYVDAGTGGCEFDYSGIVIDPNPYNGNSGSTGIKIHDVCVSNFSIDFSVSPSTDKNGDILIFENIQVGDSKIGIQAGFNEQKGNVVRGLYSVGRMHTLISVGRATRTLSGFWIFDGGYVTGKCIRLADISIIAMFPISIKDFYCENIGSVGTLIDKGSNPPRNRPAIYLQGCNFDFVYTNPQQAFIYNNSDLQKFESCRFRYLNHYQDGSTLYRTSTFFDPSPPPPTPPTGPYDYGLNNLRNCVFNCNYVWTPNKPSPPIFVMY